MKCEKCNCSFKISPWVHVARSIRNAVLFLVGTVLAIAIYTFVGDLAKFEPGAWVLVSIIGVLTAIVCAAAEAEDDEKAAKEKQPE